VISWCYGTAECLLDFSSLSQNVLAKGSIDDFRIGEQPMKVGINQNNICACPGSIKPPMRFRKRLLDFRERSSGATGTALFIRVSIGDGETPRLQAKRRSPKSCRDGRVIFE